MYELTATDELRRMLDERGVEWRKTPHYSSDSVDNETVFCGEGIEWLAHDHLNGKIGLKTLRYEITPEQVIAATLGRGNAGRYVGLRQGEYWERTENSDYYCGGCGWKVTDHDSYCPECGGALHKAALGSCNCSNDCTNGERTDTCHADETGRFSFHVWNGGPVTVHVMECSECGGTYEHVNGGYEFCPRCGRRIVGAGA